MKFIALTRPLVLATLAIGLAAGTARGGAWLQEPGTAYVRFSSGILSTQQRFDENGDRVQWDTSGGGFRNARYRDLAFSFYTEVGVARNWNVIAAGGWSHLQARQPSAEFETFGFTDITLGLKRGLGRWAQTVASVSGLVSFPTGYEGGEYPALGSDVTDLSLLGSVGTSGGGMWGTADVEYRLRGGGFRNQLRGAMGGGWNPTARLGLRGEFRGALATGSEQDASGSVRFDPTAVDPSFLDVAGTASYTIVRGVALEAEVRGTVMGKNTLAGTRWSLAVATSPAWRWRR